MAGPSKPCVCTIAGSDSGGGAGIQADLRTFAALGAWGTSVVTAVTAQNPGGILGTWNLPEEAVAAQLAAVRSAFPVGAWKTGMLATPGIIRAVAAGLPRGATLVVDPVMVATSGGRLMDAEGPAALAELLIPLAAVVTPNISEAAVLAGTGPVTGLGGMREAAGRILDLGPVAVVVKGGDLPAGPATDLFLDRSGELVLEGARYPYAVHGSGCVFSAALTAFLARGMTPREAARRAKGFMDGALGRPYRDLRGRGSADPVEGSTSGT